MIGTIITATVIVVEVGLVAYNLNKQGVFSSLKSKAKDLLNKKNYKDTQDTSFTLDAEIL